MSKQILDLMKQRKALTARREKAYNKVYAARTTAEAKRLSKAADALLAQENRLMSRITTLVDAENKRLMGKAKPKSRGRIIRR